MEEVKGLLPQTAIDKIKEILRIELLKRGILAPITLEEELSRGGEYRLNLNSEPFQTVPVIMKEIRVTNFGSWVAPETITNEKGEEISRVRINIRVHISYTHFSGGSNGTELFWFECYYYPGIYSMIADVNIV